MSTTTTDVTSVQEGVDVVIQDLEGNELASFAATSEQSFFQMAQDNNIDMPVSCCSGACFVCACTVKEGMDAIDIAKLSVPLVDIDHNQVLSCIGGVKSSAFSDGKYHKIVLQKLM